MMNKRILGAAGAASLLAFAVLAHDQSPLCDWTQWGGSFLHWGQVCAKGQDAKQALAELTFDPFVPEEKAESFGNLVAHYQVPLLAGNDVYVMVKDGSYLPCDPPGSFEPFPCGPFAWDSQVWTEKRLRWQGGKLVEKWSFASDWKPVPAVFTSTWEPMFQPALSGNDLWVPGAGGTVFKLDSKSGAVRERINPFGPDIDPLLHVAGGITPDRSGNVYYNVLRVDPEDPFFFFDARSFLVRIGTDGSTKVVPYDGLNPEAPQEFDACFGQYAFDQRPWPVLNADGTVQDPPLVACGAQRSTANMTPAIGPDGTVFTASRGFALGYVYVLALRPDLTLKWAASLRDLLDDGCGVLVPFNGPDNDFVNDCRFGAPPGIEPATGKRPAAFLGEQSSSAPVALPDGGVLIGAEASYNASRGHLFKFDAAGKPAGAYDFGWDTTPAVYRHDGTYSIVLKDNHYATGGPFFITQLDPNLVPEWKFANTNRLTCARQPDGTVSCIDDGLHPDGFEWCINAPAVDLEGTVYATSEDGNFYAIGQGGTEKSRFFLNLAEGAAYTPLAIDRKGRIFAMNNGQLTVLGDRRVDDDEDQ